MTLVTLVYFPGRCCPKLKSDPAPRGFRKLIMGVRGRAEADDAEADDAEADDAEADDAEVSESGITDAGAKDV